MCPSAFVPFPELTFSLPKVSRLRILTYLHSFEPGGVELDIFRLVRACCARGIDARIVVGRPNGALAGRARDLNFTILRGDRWSTEPFESFWLIWNLRRIVRAVRPDAIICPGNGFSLVAVGVRLSLGRDCPPIIHRVSNDLVRRDLPRPLRWANRAWQHLQARAFAVVVGMADPVRSDIVEHMGVDPRHVVVINNGSLTAVDVSRLARVRMRSTSERAGRRYLSVGRLMAQKNFDLLLTAFARIAGPTDRLTILGEGPLLSKLAKRADVLGIADRVVMPGFQSVIDPWLADADAFILSSDYEGLGTVVIEALAAGLPVVATDCGPNMAMLTNGVGRLVPPRDAVALADAMIEVVNIRPERQRMIDRARQFTVEANIDKWLNLFERVSRRTQSVRRPNEMSRSDACA